MSSHFRKIFVWSGGVITLYTAYKLDIWKRENKVRFAAVVTFSNFGVLLMSELIFLYQYILYVELFKCCIF